MQYFYLGLGFELYNTLYEYDYNSTVVLKHLTYYSLVSHPLPELPSFDLQEYLDLFRYEHSNREYTVGHHCKKCSMRGSTWELSLNSRYPFSTYYLLSIMHNNGLLHHNHHQSNSISMLCWRLLEMLCGGGGFVAGYRLITSCRWEYCRWEADLMSVFLRHTCTGAEKWESTSVDSSFFFGVCVLTSYPSSRFQY